MKFFFLALFSLIVIYGKADNVSLVKPEKYHLSDISFKCGYHNGKKLYKGPKGGCYYINSNGNKTYVDRKKCNC